MTDSPNEIWIVIDDPGDLITKKVSEAGVWVEEGFGVKYIRATPELEALIKAAVKLDATIAEFGYHVRTQEARDELALVTLAYARSLPHG